MQFKDEHPVKFLILEFQQVVFKEFSPFLYNHLEVDFVRKLEELTQTV